MEGGLLTAEICFFKPTTKTSDLFMSAYWIINKCKTGYVEWSNLKIFVTICSNSVLDL